MLPPQTGDLTPPQAAQRHYAEFTNGDPRDCALANLSWAKRDWQRIRHPAAA